jgi:NADH dehydrogenase [ubiquinone] 1 alpha subcomplex assembly factor 1
MFPTARCLGAKPAGFFKRSADELGRLSRIGTFLCLRLLCYKPTDCFLLCTAWNTEGLHTPTKPYHLLDFEDDSAVAGCKTMADRAVGGFSTASLDYIPADPSTNSPAHARFHGSISTKLPDNWRVERTGAYPVALMITTEEADAFSIRIRRLPQPRPRLMAFRSSILGP